MTREHNTQRTTHKTQYTIHNAQHTIHNTKYTTHATYTYTHVVFVVREAPARVLFCCQEAVDDAVWQQSAGPWRQAPGCRGHWGWSAGEQGEKGLEEVGEDGADVGEDVYP